jgi:hypothetical protein
MQFSPGDFLYRAEPWARTLVQHNWPIFLLSVLVILTGIQAYWRPSRPALLRLYGCLVLALAFEYQKHLVPVMVETTDYLFSEDTNPAVRSLSQLVLVDALPLAIYAWGAIALFLGLRQFRP